MKSYEIFAILNPRLSEDEVSSFVNKIELLVEQSEAKAKKNNIKLNQKLSYPIKHQKTGHMVLVQAESEKAVDLTALIDKELKTNESVIRKMVFAHSGPIEKERKPASVIDQLRHQQHEKRATVKKEVTAEPDPAKEEVAVKEETDTAEIDKKIEELLS